MAAPARALIVCPEPPYPLRGGGAFRTASLVEYLGRNYALDAVFFSEETRPDPREALPPGLVRNALLIPLPVHGRGFAAKAARNARRYLANVPPLVDRFSGFSGRMAEWLSKTGGAGGYHVAVVEHLWCASYAGILRPHARRLVIDLHNVESEWHRRMAMLEPWPVAQAHRRFAAAAERLERRLQEEFDMVLVTSGRERSLTGLEHAMVYPNTIPSRTPPSEAKRAQIVFSGNLEYQPNISAVKWFGAEVWPLLAARHPGLEWVVAGRRPEAVRHALPNVGRVRTTGEAADLTPEIARSLVAVVPIQSGSGTRIKILEAWAAGTAVVSTPLGAEGLPLEAVTLAGEAAGFARCVSELIDNETLRGEMERRGSDAFNTGFTWDVGWKMLAANGI